ncbi:DUF2515 family protein [Peribacillus sp. SCS-155]|uniref:DUF2515 family protein n=1 Tax=Peribacillus sedimenti TaxID=3115297 RepID=UPI0039068C9D
MLKVGIYIFSMIQKLFSPREEEETKQVISKAQYLHLKEKLQRELDKPTNAPNWTLNDKRDLLKRIRSETLKLNMNNITRTKAYLEFYKRNPEVHWAFLAHMVSRNGGYHMTDLKGSIMKDLIPYGDRAKYFLFLEEANAAIFADAYPQLLLYENFKGSPHFPSNLLGYFHISRFMIPIWEDFLKNRNSSLLTVALIINEQRMLQERILKKRSHIDLINGIDFKLQDFLGFTAVVFPYKKKRKQEYALTGVTVHRFAEPDKRIMTGKTLYNLLFGYSDVWLGIKDFAFSHSHTASRADYWSQIFSPNKGNPFKHYSPTLTEAWENCPFSAKTGDWFNDEEFIEDIQTLPEPRKKDITRIVLRNVLKLDAIGEIKTFI